VLMVTSCEHKMRIYTTAVVLGKSRVSTMHHLVRHALYSVNHIIYERPLERLASDHESLSCSQPLQPIIFPGSAAPGCIGNGVARMQ
jgi:hypothetical protein